MNLGREIEKTYEALRTRKVETEEVMQTIQLRKKILIFLCFNTSKCEKIMTEKRIQVFESYTKLDEETCNKFDIIAAREGMKVFRSEYETIEPPAWKTIKREMERSVALFLLVGLELVKSQEKLAKEWKFTQNWIAYEVGLACALEIDVWVLCDGVEINFPIPYLNNYSVGKFEIGEFRLLVLS